MKTTYLFICVALISCCVNAQQAPNIDWETKLGGSDTDYGFSIRELSGGGYVVAGSTKSNDGDVSGNHGETDMWMALLDVNGNLVNQYTYGGGDIDIAYDVQQTSDGGFILTGSTSSNDGDVGISYGNDDIWVVKTDASGSIVWEKTFGGSADDVARSIQETSSGDYVVVGYSRSTDMGITNHGEFDIIYLRLNNAGNPEIIKLYGGTELDYGFKVEQTQDGGYIIGGYTKSNDGDVSGNHGDFDGWALKLDANANPSIQWKTCVGTAGIEYIYNIHEHSNGSYMLVGVTNSSGFDAYTAMLQPNGTFSGEITYGGTGIDGLRGLAEMSNGDYLVVGRTSSNDGDVNGNHGANDIWTVGLTSGGGFQWQKCLGGTSTDISYSIVATSDGGSVICGYSPSSGGSGDVDVLVVKLGSPLGVEDVAGSEVTIFPNPASDHFTINLGQFIEQEVVVSVSNILGQNLFTTQMMDSQLQLNTHGWSSGLYVITLSDETGKTLTTKKLMVE